MRNAHAETLHGRNRPGRGSFVQRKRLEAGRRWIRRDGTPTGDANIGICMVCRCVRRPDRDRRLRKKSMNAGHCGEDRVSWAVGGLHGARGRSPRRLMVHRAHRARTMSAGALTGMRIRRTCPLRDRHERHGPDLAEEPDRRQRTEGTTQMRHEHTLAPTCSGCQTSPGRGPGPSPWPSRRPEPAHPNRSDPRSEGEDGDTRYRTSPELKEMKP